MHSLPARGVGDGGRDDVDVGAAERVDDGGHAPVQQVAGHVEHLMREKYSVKRMVYFKGLFRILFERYLDLRETE